MDHALAGACGEHYARRLRRDHRLEVDLVEQHGLEQLRLDQRRGDAKERLVGEADGALGNRVDVSREGELGKVVEELVREQVQRAQIGELTLGEAKLTNQGERRSKSCRHKPLPLRRQATGEKLEHRGLVQAGPQVAGRHRQLIEVDQKGGLGGAEKPGIVRIGAAHDPYSDRKSTRLNSSHVRISYAVFCLKKKKK